MILRISSLTIVFCMLVASAYAEPVSKSTTTVLNGEIEGTLVPEPVFGGSAYIIETGKEHSTSVLLVHGMGDRAARDWEKVIPVLAKDYHVIAFDLPGFGRSSKSNLLYSPSHYATFIEWVAAGYARKPFVLIGHSMGGALALRYAAEFPDSLDRLILVDAAGILHYVSLSKEMYALNSANAEKKLSRGKEEFDNFVQFMLNTVSNVSRVDGAAKIEPALKNASLRQVVLGGDPKKISGAALILEDFGAAVSAVRTPSLLIWGENDRIAPPRTAKALAGRLPNTRLKFVPEAGHVPMLERSDLFNEILLEELAFRPAAIEPAVIAEVALPDAATVRSVRYDRQKGIVLTGRYSRIEFNRCSDIRLVDATAEQIIIRSSDVTMENVVIAGNKVGLQATKADIIGTSVRIEADTAIHASRSRLDLAGAHIIGKKIAVATDSSAVLVFSISRVESPEYTGPLHGYRKISVRKPF